MNQSRVLTPAVVGLFLIAVMLTSAYLFPWRDINWGSLELQPSRVITVSGVASERQENQVAQFSAGVSAVNDNRERAVREVNEAMEKLVSQVREFGIASSDIKTENISIYQGEETYYTDGQPKQRPGQWRVNNSVQVILRDIERASALTELLSASGATNVYGPNFMIDADARPEDALLTDAIDNAREKAQVMAEASGGTLGEVISVSEGASQGFTPVFARMESGGGGGGPVEPGGSTVTKVVTVTFSLIK